LVQHRIGRTGRAGKTGKAITFFTEADKAHAGELMRVLKDAGQPVPEDLGQWGTTIKKKKCVPLCWLGLISMLT